MQNSILEIQFFLILIRRAMLAIMQYSKLVTVAIVTLLITVTSFSKKNQNRQLITKSEA